MKKKTFECAICHETFIKGRPDSEALEEKLETWTPVENSSGDATVCDGCFKVLLKWTKKNHPEFLKEAFR